MANSRYRQGTPKYFFYNGRSGSKAEMEFDDEGKIVVKQGSHVIAATAFKGASNESVATDKRNELNNRQAFSPDPDDDGRLICNEDVVFDRSSEAATFIKGKYTTGGNFWKDQKGINLSEYRVNKGGVARQPQAPGAPQQVKAAATATPPVAIQVSVSPDKITIVKRTIKDLKGKLVRMYGPGCQGCGRIETDVRYLEIDHNQPKSCGGSNEVGNRILLCGPCNRAKGHKLTLAGLRDKNREQGHKALTGNDIYFFDKEVV